MREVKRSPEKETLGWLFMIAIIFVYPTIFFLCVWFPIWMGWTSPY